MQWSEFGKTLRSCSSPSVIAQPERCWRPILVGHLSLLRSPLSLSARPLAPGARCACCCALQGTILHFALLLLLRRCCCCFVLMPKSIAHVASLICIAPLFHFVALARGQRAETPSISNCCHISARTRQVEIAHTGSLAFYGLCLVGVGRIESSFWLLLTRRIILLS